MLRTLLIALLMYCTTLAAFAQQTSVVPAQPKPIARETISKWPSRLRSMPNKIVLVTLARPGVRQKCTVRELTGDTLTCEPSHHHPPAIYQREQIAAIISPPSHTERNIMLIPIALMAASLVGSFFVPLAWSITMRIFAGLCLSVYGAMGIGMDEGDHNNDILLYQRPDTPLTVKLHA